MTQFKPYIHAMAFFVCILLSPPGTVQAAVSELPKFGQSHDFYSIGGGHRLRRQGGVDTGVSLGLNATFGLGMTCGKFDPKFAIENTLNQLKQRLTNLTSQVQTAVAALPGYIICRAAPQLCQLMQNYTVRAEELINIAIKDCQQMDADLAAGRDPLDGWIAIGRAEKLQVVGSTTGDVFTAVESAKKYNPDEGVRWVAGVKSGGINQPSIRPIADTVRAGYNILLGRSVTNGSKATGSDPLIALWSTPEAAAKWTAEVVGEVRPDINRNNAQATISGDVTGSDDGDAGRGGEDVIVTDAWLKTDGATPGLGLVPKVRKEAILIEERLFALIDQYADPTTEVPTDDELILIGGESSTHKISLGLLSMLHQDPLQGVAIAVLAQNMAVSNVMLYAMEARRMLVAGRNEPHIAAHTLASKEINLALERMETEIAFLEAEREFYAKNSSEGILLQLQAEELRYKKSGIEQKRSHGNTSDPFK